MSPFRGKPKGISFENTWLNRLSKEMTEGQLGCGVRDSSWIVNIHPKFMMQALKRGLVNVRNKSKLSSFFCALLLWSSKVGKGS